MSDHIPFEIQVEIMKNLPIKSLIQFRSVSKPWKSIIGSSDFIADYTLHNPTQQQHLLIRYADLHSEELTYVSIVDDDTFPNNKFSLTVPSSINLLHDSIIVGSSHGLLCLLGYYRNPGDSEYKSGTAMAVIWNPSIRKSVAVVVPDVDPHEGNDFGFGVCPATSDPKIVKITDTRSHRKMRGVTCSSRWLVEVFSLSSGVWRSLSGNHLSDELIEIRWPHSQVTIDGFIYWFGIRNTTGRKFHLLISFDLSSEEFREIYLPNEFAFHDPMYLYMFNRSDSLVVLQDLILYNAYEAWMMENGESNSFTKVFTVDIPNYSTLPLEFRRNGELMIRTEPDTDESDGLIVCEPFSEHIKDLGIKGQVDTLIVCSYTESLILLDQLNTSVDDEDDE